MRRTHIASQSLRWESGVVRHPLELSQDEALVDQATGFDAAVQRLRVGGVVVLRRVLSSEIVAALGAAADRKFDVMTEAAAAGTIDPQDRVYLDQHAIAVDGVSAGGVDCRKWLESVFSPIAAKILGHAVTSHMFSFFRRVEPTDTEDGLGLSLPWHQDQTILQAPLVNLWVPFGACGREAPGLELVTRRLEDRVPTETTGANVYSRGGLSIASATVQQRFADTLWCPEFAVGDAMLFLGSTVHRTSVLPGMTKRRTSVDFRFVTAA